MFGMKRYRVRLIIAAIGVIALVFAYAHRASYLHSFSRLSHVSDFQELEYTRSVHESKPSGHSSMRQLALIRWDFWRAGLPVRLEKSVSSGDRIVVRACVTDRTDTEFLYVFDSDWHFIRVFSIPLA